MDFGTDLRLVDDDIILTADGDVELVSGPAMVAQDIDQTLKTTPALCIGIGLLAVRLCICSTIPRKSRYR